MLTQLQPRSRTQRAAIARARPSYILSVDLGQQQDPTAIAVLEVLNRRQAADMYAFRDPSKPVEDTEVVPSLDWYNTKDGGLYHPERIVRIDVRHLERLPLGMNYVEQISYVSRLLARPPLTEPGATFLADMTGVGRPVVQMFRSAGLRPIGITITAGNAVTEVTSPHHEYHVAKLLLMSELQAAMNAKILHIAPDLPEARTLMHEMSVFRATITASGYTRFGAREGEHDDLVLAVAQGVWYACQPSKRVTIGSYQV